MSYSNSCACTKCKTKKEYNDIYGKVDRKKLKEMMINHHRPVKSKEHITNEVRPWHNSVAFYSFNHSICNCKESQYGWCPKHPQEPPVGYGANDNIVQPLRFRPDDFNNPYCDPNYTHTLNGLIPKRDFLDELDVIPESYGRQPTYDWIDHP